MNLQIHDKLYLKFQKRGAWKRRRIFKMNLFNLKKRNQASLKLIFIMNTYISYKVKDKHAQLLKSGLLTVKTISHSFGECERFNHVGHRQGKRDGRENAHSCHHKQKISSRTEGH
jgi:hypothetical protein